MLIHPQSLLDVALRQGARREVGPAGSCSKAGEGCVAQPDAQRLAHVVHGSAAHYKLQRSAGIAVDVTALRAGLAPRGAAQQRALPDRARVLAVRPVANGGGRG